MLLLELKNFLKAQRLVSMADLVKNFNHDPDHLRIMLQHWVHKKKLRQLNKTSLCQTKCVKCDPLTIELYEWLDE